MFRVFPKALDPCFSFCTLSHSSPCNAYQWGFWKEEGLPNSSTPQISIHFSWGASLGNYWPDFMLGHHWLPDWTFCSPNLSSMQSCWQPSIHWSEEPSIREFSHCKHGYYDWVSHFFLEKELLKCGSTIAESGALMNFGTSKRVSMIEETSSISNSSLTTYFFGLVAKKVKKKA